MKFKSLMQAAILTGAVATTPWLHGATGSYRAPANTQDVSPAASDSWYYMSPSQDKSQNGHKNGNGNGNGNMNGNGNGHMNGNGNGNMNGNGNGNMKNGNGDTAPSMSYKQRLNRKNTTARNSNQGYWSPNQAQKMSATEFSDAQRSGVKQNQATPAAPQPTNGNNHPASYYKKEEKTVLQKIKEDPQLSTFATAIEAAGLTSEINEGGPYTIFAPTNEAFRQLPRGTLDRLFRTENQRDLYMIIAYHIVPGKVKSKDGRSDQIRTLNGKDLNLESARGTIVIDDAEVIRQDIDGNNGVIQVIDTVLLPNS